jgi:hypothetical protein
MNKANVLKKHIPKKIEYMPKVTSNCFLDIFFKDMVSKKGEGISNYYTY